MILGVGQGDAEGLGSSVACAGDEKFASAFEAFQAEGFAVLNPVLRAWLGLFLMSQILATPETSGNSMLHRCVVMNSNCSVSAWSSVHLFILLTETDRQTRAKPRMQSVGRVLSFPWTGLTGFWFALGSSLCQRGPETRA